jgi:hypothetical protein
MLVAYSYEVLCHLALPVLDLPYFTETKRTYATV